VKHLVKIEVIRIKVIKSKRFGEGDKK